MNNLRVPTLQTHIGEEKLDLVESVFESNSLVNLENVVLIGAQHILPSTLTMLNSFFERGLSPENVFLIGKCYSTDIQTYYRLLDLGVYVCPSSLTFKKQVAFDSQYTSNIRSFVNKSLAMLPSRNKPCIVVLDDGGMLISQLNDYADKKSSIVGLEQTTSGYQRIKKLNLKMGVINVARSKAKLQYESKIIAKTVVRELCNKFATRQIHDPERVLIFGNGAIGNATAAALEGHFNTSFVDIDPKKSDIFLDETMQSIQEFDLIIGCVGKTILSLENIKKLRKGTTLVSLSSSDREFEIVALRSQSSLIFSCHDDFNWNGINILNCGFPLNFSGIASDVDIQEFELTRSLLTLGVLQGIQQRSEKGLLPLCDAGQNMLISRFLEKYSKSLG